MMQGAVFFQLIWEILAEARGFSILWPHKGGRES